MIRTDLNILVRKLQTDILPGEDAIQWGIRVTESLIDRFPRRLPFLRSTAFNDYVSAISDLLDSSIDSTKHSEITKIMNQVSKHPDSIVIGQFSANEMIDYYRFLNSDFNLLTRNNIIECLNIYEKLCAIFEKDLALAYCLLKLKETRFSFDYTSVPRGARGNQTVNQYCLKRLPVFRRSYNDNMRNSTAHFNIETRDTPQILIAHPLNEGVDKQLPYEQVLTICREMAALVLAFRLFSVILAIADWKVVGAVLHVK